MGKFLIGLSDHVRSILWVMRWTNHMNGFKGTGVQRIQLFGSFRMIRGFDVLDLDIKVQNESIAIAGSFCWGVCMECGGGIRVLPLRSGMVHGTEDRVQGYNHSPQCKLAIDAVIKFRLLRFFLSDLVLPCPLKGYKHDLASHWRSSTGHPRCQCTWECHEFRLWLHTDL